LSDRSARARRLLIYAAVGSSLLLACIEVAARLSVRRGRMERSHLGDRLFTEVAGEYGPAIVFLPGLEGSTRYWDHRFDYLVTTDHRVIYADLLGFGRSPWPDGDYTLEDQIAALRRTLVARQATHDVTLVGHSFGAVIAAHYAARYPDDIGSLVLIGTPVYDSPREAKTRIRSMSSLGGIFTLNTIVARETCQLMCAARPLFRRIVPRVSSLPRKVAEDSVMHSWPAYRGAMNILLTQPVAAPLQRLGPRTIFIQGTRDRVTPLERIHALATQIGARVVTIDSDHQEYAGHVDELARVIAR
jgi:pimeloyl-ACP methyl ester carboxylesterase